ncbi:uncharacterized protein C8Q71DRAFT_92352 [Rhodofomes roseus]|uniref:Secreted protein n=1 Tax=Rhodofomes roseus TaxID=34475 RepID=A0ABQ8KDT5_9APHY|nr:uncharacterized protein C8Q71DRAFT_92352 [Rhodofomes roseus]KAH9835712.1 hypothetical protein C8Q71DRAFT_92352 [Rhodofomes roseus]
MVLRYLFTSAATQFKFGMALPLLAALQMHLDPGMRTLRSIASPSSPCGLIGTSLRAALQDAATTRATASAQSPLSAVLLAT